MPLFIVTQISSVNKKTTEIVTLNAMIHNALRPIDKYGQHLFRRIAYLLFIIVTTQEGRAE